MIRPCFLVVDREYPGSISTRKLVIETAKLNVLTAYTGDEALRLLEKFPAVDGIVIDVAVEDMGCEDLVAGIKALQPKLPIIAITSPAQETCLGADFQLDSFQPSRLLEIIGNLQPKATREIELRNEQLSREQGTT